MATKLSRSELTKLDSIISAKSFDSSDAFDLDYAILSAVAGGNLNYDTQASLDRPQQLYFAAWWLEGEVNNGGFSQLFMNKGALTAKNAELFCRERGLPLVESLVGRAIKAVGPEAMSSNDALQERVYDDDASLSEQLESLDNEFFELDPSPPFIETRLRFAREHAASFFG